ncbi:MAG: PrsW family glutamic-type intramembrane protease [Akkermansia sp.]
MKTMYILQKGHPKEGPFTKEEIIRRYKAGEYSDDSLIWAEGMQSWISIREYLGSYDSGGLIKEVMNTVAGFVGMDEIKIFNAKYFFGDIFRKHQESEIVDFFCSGSKETTPPLNSIVTTWPAPWIFTRTLLLSILLWIGFSWMCNHYLNANTFPGFFFASSFAIPFSFLVLFAELNIRRDIPWYTILKMLLGGGLIALIFTCIFNVQTNNPQDAYWAGPIEESAKLLATIVIARKYLNGNILSGVLCGAAIGAGFAIFETAGYIFTRGYGQSLELIASNHNESISSILQKFMNIAGDTAIWRGCLSPFCHIVWTAIIAGALWRIIGTARFSPSMLKQGKFLRIAIIPVLLHMFWNSNLLADNVYKYAICGLIAWSLVMLLINEGITQVKRAQSKDCLFTLKGTLSSSLPVSYPVPLQSLTAQNSYTIGRDPSSNLCIPDSTMSSCHAILKVREGKLLLGDNGSSNGTSVNGQQLHQNEYIKLRSGDRIVLGQVSLVLYLGS